MVMRPELLLREVIADIKGEAVGTKGRDGMVASRFATESFMVKDRVGVNEVLRGISFGLKKIMKLPLTPLIPLCCCGSGERGRDEEHITTQGFEGGLFGEQLPDNRKDFGCKRRRNK